MNQRGEKVDVSVEEVKDSAPGSSNGMPSVVIETESKVDGDLRSTSIEVRDVDAPAVAAALLNSDVAKPLSSDDLPVAVQCLAVGVVHGANAGMLRLHLQFESGQVLPIEMTRDAALALSDAMADHVRRA